jgi:hypothetical protein
LEETNNMVFRRPELEKDNPIAPQPYVGPRRRLALARAAASGKSTEMGDRKETLQTLAEAASRYVDSLPTARRRGRSFKALQDAIAEAEQVLTAEGCSRMEIKAKRTIPADAKGRISGERACCGGTHREDV